MCLNDGWVKIRRNRSFPNDFEGFKGLLDWSIKGMSKGMSLKYVPEAAGCYLERSLPAWPADQQAGSKLCKIGCGAQRVEQVQRQNRVSKKGNAAIRQCLFMPALSAVGHNKKHAGLFTQELSKRTRKPNERQLSPECVNC
ncbi:hypothetical protein Barb6_01737 [Bacteroidales bacterium Barb6]|nr:hypothetical protein Barb6_01737 [Bacteroidales bacterium Barb6]